MVFVIDFVANYNFEIQNMVHSMFGHMYQHNTCTYFLVQSTSSQQNNHYLGLIMVFIALTHLPL
jgi:hypothetical protein